MPEKLADNFVYENECLEICGDICNGIKHLQLTRPKRTPPAKFEEKLKLSIRVNEGQLVGVIWKLIVSTDKGKLNAFGLATECMDKWREFIEQNIEQRGTRID